MDIVINITIRLEAKKYAEKAGRLGFIFSHRNGAMNTNHNPGRPRRNIEVTTSL